jgi:hypothetical protein
MTRAENVRSIGLGDGDDSLLFRWGSGFEGERILAGVLGAGPWPMTGGILGELTDRPCDPNDPLNSLRPKLPSFGDLYAAVSDPLAGRVKVPTSSGVGELNGLGKSVNAMGPLIRVTIGGSSVSTLCFRLKSLLSFGTLFWLRKPFPFPFSGRVGGNECDSTSGNLVSAIGEKCSLRCKGGEGAIYCSSAGEGGRAGLGGLQPGSLPGGGRAGMSSYFIRSMVSCERGIGAVPSGTDLGVNLFCVFKSFEDAI